MQRAWLGWGVPLLFAVACGPARESDAICDSPVERYAGTVMLTDRLDVLFVVDASPSMLNDPRLAPSAADVPSCTTPTAVAYAPRRLIELAAAWPSNVSLRSICDYDLSHALAQVAGVIAKRLSRGPLCLRQPVTRDSEGRVQCRVTWELPGTVDPDEPFTPAACEDLPDLLSVPSGDQPARSARGRTVCELRQAPVEQDATGALVPRGEGFYFDPHDPFRSCGDLSLGMLKWTNDAVAPPGVRMVVQCGEEPTRPAAGSCASRPECLGAAYSCLDGELRRE